MQHVFQTEGYSITLRFSPCSDTESDVDVNVKWDSGFIHIRGFSEFVALAQLSSEIDVRYEDKQCNAQLSDIDQGFTIRFESNQLRDGFDMIVNLAVNDWRGRFETSSLPLSHEQLSEFEFELRQYLHDHL